MHKLCVCGLAGVGVCGLAGVRVVIDYLYSCVVIDYLYSGQQDDQDGLRKERNSSAQN